MQVQQCDKNHFPQYALRKNLSCAGTSPQRAWHSTAGRQSSHRIVRARSARRESDSHKRAAAHERRRLAYDGGSFAFRSIEEAQAAMRQCFLNALAAARHVAGAYPRCACSGWVLLFHQQRILQTSTRCQRRFRHCKRNLREKGVHARAAVGVPSLPLGASVELEVTFSL
jgi:enamine deaminase RidA (YjgF/YER057c/UK114 family)